MSVVGVGLMEIVTEPDFRSSLEAASFVKELQAILKAIRTCDAIMAGREIECLETWEIDI